MAAFNEQDVTTDCAEHSPPDVADETSFANDEDAEGVPSQGVAESPSCDELATDRASVASTENTAPKPSTCADLVEKAEYFYHLAALFEGARGHVQQRFKAEHLQAPECVIGSAGRLQVCNERARFDAIRTLYALWENAIARGDALMNVELPSSALDATPEEEYEDEYGARFTAVRNTQGLTRELPRAEFEPPTEPIPKPPPGTIFVPPESVGSRK